MWFIFILVITLTLSINAKEFLLELEEFAEPWKNQTVTQRSRASNLKAVHLYNGSLKAEFCLTKESDIIIEDVKFSNDGGEDEIQILFNWDVKGIVNTVNNSRSGRGWNFFRSSGPIAEIYHVRPGHHTIIFNISETDMHGIELDVIRLFINDKDLEEHVFRCEAFCFDSIYHEHIAGKDFIESARIEQRSFNTSCTEKDNVIIPFYHETATEYVIKASHPRYKAFVNNRLSNFDNCSMGSKTIWTFENFSFPLEKPYKSKNTFLSESRIEHKPALFFHFTLDGPEKGIMDSEIGSRIDLLLGEIKDPIEVGFLYYTRNNSLSQPVYKSFDAYTENLTWDVPDFTWIEGSSNILGLIFPSDKEIFIRKVQLNKRHQEDDSSFPIYDNTDIIIEGVKVDFWWQKNHKMTVELTETGEMFNDADYVRFYFRVPWEANKYSQVFVIYADGNVRLLPMTPPGLDWIPFGSSLLIGHSNPNKRRPSAPISHIDIDPKRHFLTITYLNNDTATIHISVTFSETIIFVRHLNFTEEEAHLPFLTFRSMWVADGNADVDHISVNGNPPRRIMSDWKTLFGTSFVFYRKCLSSHNTLSPDIRVEMFKN